MKTRIEIAIGLLVTVMVAVALVVWIASTGIIGYEIIVSVAVVGILIAFATYVLWDKARNARKGLPTKDERIERISHRAGYYGFIAAIWSAVLASPLAELLSGHKLTADLVTASVVIVAGLVFAISYLYLASKRN